MEVLFEVQFLQRIGKKRQERYYVFAKCLDEKMDFQLTENARLGGIAIGQNFEIVSGRNKDGTPIYGVLRFKIRDKNAWNILQKGQIVALTNEKIDGQK